MDKLKRVIPDDLDVGDLVVATGRLDGWDDIDLNGLPYRVEAVALPFVAVSYKADVFAIDTRVWRLGRVSAEYQKAMTSGQAATPAELAANDPRRCVRCGERMVQRFVRPEIGWHWHCNRCGSDGGPVPASV